MLQTKAGKNYYSMQLDACEFDESFSEKFDAVKENVVVDKDVEILFDSDELTEKIVIKPGKYRA